MMLGELSYALEIEDKEKREKEKLRRLSKGMIAFIIVGSIVAVGLALLLGYINTK